MMGKTSVACGRVYFRINPNRYSLIYLQTTYLIDNVIQIYPQTAYLIDIVLRIYRQTYFN